MRYLVIGIHPATLNPDGTTRYPARESCGSTLQALCEGKTVRVAENRALVMRTALKSAGCTAYRIYSLTNVYDDKTYRLLSTVSL